VQIILNLMTTWLKPDLLWFMPKNLRKISADFDSVMKLCLKFIDQWPISPLVKVLPLFPSAISDTWIAPCIFRGWWDVIPFESQ
jgi:hypothetical protein